MKYWMISNRDRIENRLGAFRDKLRYWMSTGGKLDDLGNWQEVDQPTFFRHLMAEAGNFPLILDPEHNTEQKHITFFVHGFNQNWSDAVDTYDAICKQLYDGPASLGLCVLFNWPSDGLVTNYYPDRVDARTSAPDLAEVFSVVYEILLQKQREGIADPTQSCRAKLSVIAHSMGNYLLQKAFPIVWDRHHRPLLTSLVNQLVMAAPDIDNDVFKSGEHVDASEGDAMANLTYRITALYSGRDSVLGLSAGLKHFGKRRLGRSGIDPKNLVADNIWDLDVSRLFPPDSIRVHTAYFDEQVHHPTYNGPSKLFEVIRLTLQGFDRSIVSKRATEIAFK